MIPSAYTVPRFPRQYLPQGEQLYLRATRNIPGAGVMPRLHCRNASR